MSAAECHGHDPKHSSLLRFAPGSINRSLWFWTVVCSIAIAAWFVLTVEPGSLASALTRIDTAALLISLACLTANGLLDAVWLRLMTRPAHPRSGPLRVIAWHMLGSSILPARLGELAFIYFIHRWLEVPGARALFITLYHRLQDFIVINLFMLLSILGVGFETQSLKLVPVASVMLGLLLLVLARLEASLTLAAGILQRMQRATGARFLRTLLLHLLQVRGWYRHRLTPAQLWLSFVVIALRWAAILPAIGIVLHASVDTLNWPHSLFVTNAYIYMGIIPIQAVGGFGAGEAGLIWLLSLYGLSIGAASALSLLIRLLINSVHIGIWLVTVTGLFVLAPANHRA